MCSHGDNHDNCSVTATSVQQSLSELDFERGLWTAALDNDVDRCQELMRKGHDVNQKDSSGYTPLHYAVRSSSVQLVRLLIDAGANVNAQTSAGKATPLHRAVTRGRPETVKLLLEKGADPKKRDVDGKTPLHICCKESSKETLICAQMLLAKPDLHLCQDVHGKTASDYIPEKDAEKWRQLLDLVPKL